MPIPVLDERPEATDPAAEALVIDLDRLAHQRCSGCDTALCGHVILFSIALGAKDSPRCLRCLAATLERDPTELTSDLTDHLRHRDCYRAAWSVACTREGQPLNWQPPCLHTRTDLPCTPSVPTQSDEQFSTCSWDAGELGCGELLLGLRLRLNALAPGGRLHLIARDPAAPHDLPAWCRLTGHVLLEAQHPHYILQRKEK